MTRWRAPLGLALIGLTLVPTTGLVASSATTAVERERVVEQASTLAADADRLGDLLALRFAISREGFPVQALPAVRQLGVSPALVEELLGVDLEFLAAGAIADLDRLAARVGTPRLDERLDAVRRARRAAADGTMPLDELASVYAAAENAATEALTSAMASLRQGAAAGKSDLLARHLAVLVEMLEAQRTGQASLRNLASQMMPSVAMRGTALRLATDYGAYERAALQLDVMDLDAVEGAWHAFRDKPSTRLYERDVRNTLQALLGEAPAPPTDFEAIGATFNAGLERAEDLRGLGEAAARQVRSTADAMAAKASAEFRETVAATVGLVVLALGLAGAVTSAVLRPIRRLERSALSVSGGALDLELLPERGPRELAIVARAHNEMLANLRALETQAGALAAGALDDPILRDPVPGRLGDAVQASVAQLSSSLVERDQLQRRLAHEATHDALTGLANRAAAVADLEEAVASGRRTAVLFIDLDEFKRANDTYGHVVGDAVLRRVASVLVERVRRGDRVARLGGDEFLVIADVAEAGEAVALGERIVAGLSEPMVVEGVPVAIGASVGVAVSDDQSTALELLRDADVAVYEAKRSGKRRVQVLGEELRRQVAERADLERELRASVAGGRLQVHFQPIVPLVVGRLPSTLRAEALVRWPLTDGRLLAAEAFIGVAEAGDVLVDLGHQVLEEAVAHLAAWDAGGPPLAGLELAVNLSRRELHDPALEGRLAAVLEAHGIAPDRILFEVAEAALVADLDRAGARLAALRAIGCRVAIDNFGEGTTAMSVLRLPVDVLKLDRSLVASLHDARHRALTELVIDAAHRLGVSVVAEGVESADQLATLADAGCDLAQGFWIGEPMEPQALVRWALDRPVARAGGAARR